MWGQPEPLCTSPSSLPPSPCLPHVHVCAAGCVALTGQHCTWNCVRPCFHQARRAGANLGFLPCRPIVCTQGVSASSAQKLASCLESVQQCACRFYSPPDPFAVHAAAWLLPLCTRFQRPRLCVLYTRIAHTAAAACRASIDLNDSSLMSMAPDFVPFVFHHRCTNPSMRCMCVLATLPAPNTQHIQCAIPSCRSTSRTLPTHV